MAPRKGRSPSPPVRHGQVVERRQDDERDADSDRPVDQGDGMVDPWRQVIAQDAVDHFGSEDECREQDHSGDHLQEEEPQSEQPAPDGAAFIALAVSNRDRVHIGGHGGRT